ncbi:hypothetical protein [Listeria fleischmannii]|uniref:hypothetical protein n=1 Tax=Listeria fleischmannii TaxID=1069827 RepID=UPI000254F9BF|nr:hypothetical protein [Listeria fleischmannii]EIA21395.1 hypothetical protein KKC_01357 [Listeria fleischmannii subsp. coloradonensis]STY35281.1 Uncharacterised protein [Listeria fleischmannii subsp. coloradonensis]
MTYGVLIGGVSIGLVLWILCIKLKKTLSDIKQEERARYAPIDKYTGEVRIMPIYGGNISVDIDRVILDSRGLKMEFKAYLSTTDKKTKEYWRKKLIRIGFREYRGNFYINKFLSTMDDLMEDLKEEEIENERD